MRQEIDPQITANRAYAILQQAYGPDAQFRPGQLEAIQAVMAGRNSLVVQKTGWGKSLVYFIATRILRESGAGPTVIVSPLLALMENQIDSAQAIGVSAVTINSGNYDQWDEIYASMNAIDALIVSPERLANERFMERLADIKDIRLLVVDEAHSISDWGHDFRPDYQRVAKLIEGLPGNITVLGTTATANDRVIADIKNQLGENLQIVRGDLIRENLAIQVNPPQTREQRLAWLARALTEDELLSQGQGIIYCLTHSSCNAVAEFLSGKGVSILPYYSGMGEDDYGNSIEQMNLDRFVRGETRVLAATIKLGMGYDKSDIRFVIHFQLPQNLIAYYQQIGRAGRDGHLAYAILLHGREDEEILRYFIETAQASPNLLGEIVSKAQRGTSRTELMAQLNVKPSKLGEALQYLMVHDYIYKDGVTYRANIAKNFEAEEERRRQSQLAAIRIKEHEDLLRYLTADDCYMKRVAAELDAPDARESCGICANCKGDYFIPVGADRQTVSAAGQYLGSRHGTISPRKRRGNNKMIGKELLMQPGWTLYADYYSAAGQKVGEDKYANGSFSDELVEASADFLRGKAREAGIDCVVPIPSLRRPNLVPDFAKRLADALGVPYAKGLRRTQAAVEQKTLFNSAQQELNISQSIAADNDEAIRDRAILLVDDMVDSRWTLTVAAAVLLEAGARLVYPFALVSAGGGD